MTRNIHKIRRRYFVEQIPTQKMKIRREIADDDHYNKYWAVYNAKVGPFLTHNTEDYSIEP